MGFVLQQGLKFAVLDRAMELQRGYLCRRRIEMRPY